MRDFLLNGVKVMYPMGAFQKALDFETTRQNSLKSRDIPIESEVRVWDSDREITVSGRGNL